MSRMPLYALPFVLMFGLASGCSEERRARVAITPAEEQTDNKDNLDNRKKKEDRTEKGDDAEPKESKKAKFTDLEDIHAEVNALHTLRWLDLSDKQLEAIGKLARQTARKSPPRKEIEASQAYRTALLNLRAALRGGSEEKIEAVMAELEALRETDDPLFDPVEITDAARKEAPALFDSLSARQVVAYLSGLGDHFPDPVELLTQALAQTREKRGKEWRAYRDDVAAQVGWLIAGLDSGKEETIRKKATALLDQGQDLTDKQFREQKDALERSARELTGKLRSLDYIRHYLERVLAETLSNDRLAVAVAEVRKGRGVKER